MISARPSRVPTIIVISIISILVLNAGVAPMQHQVYATTAAIPKTSDLKEDIKQDIDEQATCHRGENCKEADEGQQVVGNENAVAGINDQSKNVQQQQNQIIT